MLVYYISTSGRNKGQKLVGHFLKIGHFCKLSIAIPLKMYSKFGRPQMVKLVKWPMADLFLALIYWVFV